METDCTSAAAAAESESVVAQASKRTRSYLREAAKFAVQNGLPPCIAAAWSSRALDVGVSRGVCCADFWKMQKKREWSVEL